MHSCTNRRVKHPCRHDDRSARLSFDDNNLSPGPHLTVIAPHRTPVERVPLVVNLCFLPDYGQNNPATALGRRAWLFAGSERGAERAAVVITLIITARLNEVDPQAWLADIFARIADLPQSRLHELLPWEWKQRATEPAVAKAA